MHDLLPPASDERGRSGVVQEPKMVNEEENWVKKALCPVNKVKYLNRVANKERFPFFQEARLEIAVCSRFLGVRL